MTPNGPDMDDGGRYEYLARSIAIVTLLHERGILEELFAQGRLTEEEVERRVELLRRRYPDFTRGAQPADIEAEEDS